ncbi:MAG: hypothetical protein U9N07_07580 [Euryarchaeota archaeon]|nr:hypothetical protein [Euryarchaeota archaeon]
MNISTIFFNNGQLNWDAIGTISNILLVLSLVVITWWYANKVNEQTNLMIKDRERGQILEEIQDVLTSTMHHLEREISAIEKGEKRIFKVFYGKVEHTYACKDIFRKHPDLEGKLRSHDNLCDKLNENGLIQLKKLNEEILENIKEIIEKYRKEYNFTKYEIDPELKNSEEELEI